MIQFTRSFCCSDGNVFSSLTLAQKHELGKLIKDTVGQSVENLSPTSAADIIVAHADKVIDILTTTATSRPKARKANGGRKPRKTLAAPVNQPLKD